MPEDDPRWQHIDAKLPENDHARIIQRQVDQLDRSCVDDLYHGLGKDAFDRLILLKMVLYQYLKGRRSPATWAEAARLDEAVFTTVPFDTRQVTCRRL